MKFSNRTSLLSLLLITSLLASCATQERQAFDAPEWADQKASKNRTGEDGASGRPDGEEKLTTADFEETDSDDDDSPDSLVEAILNIDFFDSKKKKEKPATEQPTPAAKKPAAPAKQAPAVVGKTVEPKPVEPKPVEPEVVELSATPSGDLTAAQQEELNELSGGRLKTVTKASPAAKPEAKIPAKEELPAAAMAEAAAEAAPAERIIPQRKTLTAANREQAGQAEAAAKYYKLALEKRQAGETEAALRLFKDIASQYPTLTGPVVNQAIILREQGKLVEAKTVLESALLIKSSSPYLMNELGIVYRHLGKFKQAQQAYESAIRRDEAYDKAHYNLGVLADLYLHQPALALAAFQRYQDLQVEPDKKVAGWIIEIERRVK